jgi:hypothetical protein
MVDRISTELAPSHFLDLPYNEIEVYGILLRALAAGVSEDRA